MKYFSHLIECSHFWFPYSFPGMVKKCVLKFIDVNGLE